MMVPIQLHIPYMHALSERRRVVRDAAWRTIPNTHATPAPPAPLFSLSRVPAQTYSKEQGVDENTGKSWARTDHRMTGAAVSVRGWRFGWGSGERRRKVTVWCVHCTSGTCAVRAVQCVFGEVRSPGEPVTAVTVQAALPAA